LRPKNARSHAVDSKARRLCQEKIEEPILRRVATKKGNLWGKAGPQTGPRRKPTVRDLKQETDHGERHLEGRDPGGNFKTEKTAVQIEDWVEKGTAHSKPRNNEGRKSGEIGKKGLRGGLGQTLRHCLKSSVFIFRATHDGPTKIRVGRKKRLRNSGAGETKI